MIGCCHRARAAKLLRVIVVSSVWALDALRADAWIVCPGDVDEDGHTTIDEVVAVVGSDAEMGPIAAAVAAALDDCTGTPPTPNVSSVVAKVKNLLVGLPPTDAEVQSVSNDPLALQTLVGEWTELPQYSEKMLSFFITQFQQDQWEFRDLTFQFVGKIPFASDQFQIVQNFQESFARTVMQLIAEGEPLTSAMTTTRFMMTPALMAAYATLDNIHVDDSYNSKDLFARDHPASVTLQPSVKTSIEEVSDPSSPNFLNFYAPNLAMPYADGCAYGTIVYPAPAEILAVTQFLFSYTPFFSPPRCFPPLVSEAHRYIRASDFTTWRMINIRQPQPGESTRAFYDLPAMRAGLDLILNKPRVGFFTTPAFNARWQTNDDNQFRVTLNQTLIVALGQPIDLTNSTQPPSLAALDEQHAQPRTTCYACHQSLDPMRQFFRQTYTYYLSQQDRSEMTSMPGEFGFHGVSATGSGIQDLGVLLAHHPMFATAWTQKLCTYATSTPCDPNDSEFQRLVGVFRETNYSWSALVQAMFTSPLVTYLEETRTADVVGQTFPIARQTHLCATLSNRLGVADVCGLRSQGSDQSATKIVAASWPSDQYSRGSQRPALAHDPSLMVRGGMESICVELAGRVVDSGPLSKFQSSAPEVAVHNLATGLMGLTNDRAAEPEAILNDHFSAALETGASPKEALQSTFTVACLSPYVVGVGL